MASQVGPSHHRVWCNNSPGIMPLEAQSAGLSRVGTWNQDSGGTSLSMAEMWFPTKVRYFLELPSNQARTIVLSHHALISLSGMSKAFLTLVSSLDNRFAPQSSSLGTDNVLIGATLVLEATRATIGGWSR